MILAHPVIGFSPFMKSLFVVFNLCLVQCNLRKPKLGKANDNLLMYFIFVDTRRWNLSSDIALF